MCLSSRQGACGPHDTYGSALTAQPGWSQGRPDNNTSSQLIKYFGLPTSRAPDTPVPVSPGYSRRADDSTPPVVPRKSMPDNKSIEQDHRAIKRDDPADARLPEDENSLRDLEGIRGHANDPPRSLHRQPSRRDRRNPSGQPAVRSCGLSEAPAGFIVPIPSYCNKAVWNSPPSALIENSRQSQMTARGSTIVSPGTLSRA